MKNIKRLALAGLAFFAALGICSTSVKAGNGGDRRSTAEQISLNQNVSGVLVQNNDQNRNYYKINITDSGIYRFTGSTDVSVDTELIVDVARGNDNYDHISTDKPTWNNNTGSGTWNYRLTLSRGIYYVSVYEWNDKGNYSFKITEEKSGHETMADNYGDEHRASTAHDMNLGQNINGVIAQGEQTDYYRVQVNDTGKYRLTGSTDISSDVELSLRNAEGYQFYYSKPTWNNNTTSGTWDYTITLSRGTYYVTIYEWNDKGTYSFKMIESQSAGETYPDYCGDDHTLNTAHDINIGATIKGAITQYEQKDYFRFKVSKAGVYSVKGNSYISSDSEIYVRDSNGYEISSQKPVWNNNTNSGTWNFNVSLGAGTYYVQVYEWDDKGFYNFSVNNYVKQQPKKAETKDLKVPGLKKVEGKKKSITVKWGKVNSGITGYQVQYSTDKNFKKKVKTVTISKKGTASTTIKKLKKKTKYFVRVRSYKQDGSKKTFSKWSKVKNAKTK